MKTDRPPCAESGPDFGFDVAPPIPVLTPRKGLSMKKSRDENTRPQARRRPKPHKRPARPAKRPPGHNAGEQRKSRQRPSGRDLNHLFNEPYDGIFGPLRAQVEASLMATVHRAERRLSTLTEAFAQMLRGSFRTIPGGAADAPSNPHTTP
jgi:hypothetical protein